MTWLFRSRRPRRWLPNCHRPQVEALNERILPSTCHVTRLGDQGIGQGERGDLRYCVNAANNNQAEGIDLTVAGTIQVGRALPSLATAVPITGPGADLLKVSGSGSVGPSFRVFTVLASGTVAISGLTIANGFAHNDGGGRHFKWGPPD